MDDINSLTGQSDHAFVWGYPGHDEVYQVVGDWNGDGKSSVGFYNSSDASWHLSDSVGAGPTNYAIVWGPTGSNIRPLTGDWDGDGKTSIGYYNVTDGSFHLKTNLTQTGGYTFTFAPANDPSIQPVVGDWDGDGVDSVGWYRPSDGSWHLTDSLSAPISKYKFVAGPAGDTSVTAVTGDWYGTGETGIGWYRPSDSSWHLDGKPAAPHADSFAFIYGPSNDGSVRPLVGDWDGPPPTTTPPATSTLEANAKAIVDSGRLTDTSTGGPNHVPQHLLAELNALANGTFASYPGPDGELRKCQLDPALVAFVKEAIVDHNHSMAISNWNEWCDSSGGISTHVHPGGNAVDIDKYGVEDILDGGKDGLGNDLIGYFGDTMHEAAFSSKNGRVSQVNFRDGPKPGLPSNVQEVCLGDPANHIHFDTLTGSGYSLTDTQHCP